MASHFGQINAVDGDNWVGFKVIADNAGASKIFYCEHTDHYTVVVTLSGLCFMHILARPSTDATDFDNNRKGTALKVN